MAIHSLGYITIEATDLDQWTDFGNQMLGMATNPNGSDANNLLLKMDDRPYRIAVEKGSRDAYGVSGWECNTPDSYADTQRRLRAAGVELTAGTAEEAARRQVQELVRFTDPSGNRHELFWGAVSDFGRFISPVGVKGFVTGDMGMGHTVLPAPNFDATVKFFTEVLGFGLSDLMKVKFTPDPNEPEKRLYFLHCNRRHHSLALFEMENPSGCIHIMVEVPTFDEVGYAMDRLHAKNIPLGGTLGRHANDGMVSFYMATPAGFMVEYGAEGMVVEDWNRYSAFQSTVNSFWGHVFNPGAAH